MNCVPSPRTRQESLGDSHMRPTAGFAESAARATGTGRIYEFTRRGRYLSNSLLSMRREKKPTHFLSMLFAAVKNWTCLRVSRNTSRDNSSGSRN